MTGTRAEPESDQVRRYMLVAKYIGIVDGSDTAIAHEVYVARVGRKHRTKLNSDVSVELGSRVVGLREWPRIPSSPFRALAHVADACPTGVCSGCPCPDDA